MTHTGVDLVSITDLFGGLVSSFVIAALIGAAVGLVLFFIAEA
jgi:hypothetical protein